MTPKVPKFIEPVKSPQREPVLSSKPPRFVIPSTPARFESPRVPKFSARTRKDDQVPREPPLKRRIENPFIVTDELDDPRTPTVPKFHVTETKERHELLPTDWSPHKSRTGRERLKFKPGGMAEQVALWVPKPTI